MKVSVSIAMIAPVRSISDLGIYIRLFPCLDAVSCCQNRIILFCRPTLNSQLSSVITPVLQSLVILLVLTRLDYGSETPIADQPNQLLDRFQLVMNADTRLVFSVQKYDHVTPLLHNLHCLRAPQGIEYSPGIPL